MKEHTNTKVNGCIVAGMLNTRKIKTKKENKKMKKYNRNFVIYSDELGDILAIVLCNDSDYEKIQAWIEQFYKEYEKTRNGEFFIGQLYQLYEDSEAYGLDFELQLCEDTICVYHVEP